MGRFPFQLLPGAVMDYCTFWFEGWWAHCCQAHDDDYIAQVGRAIADWDLMTCVATAAPHPVLAVLSVVIAVGMFLAVRLFGGRFYK